MKTVTVKSIVAFSFFASPYVLYGQQVEAPIYKDGDWWKVKVEVSYPGGLSRSGRCEEDYSEYLVKIEQGKPKVSGVRGNIQEEIDCSTIEAQLLDSGPETRGFLKFPLSIGSGWTFRYLRANPGGRSRWTDVESKVVSLEKIKTQKGEFEVYKIERIISRDSSEIYFYSPKAKAIALFDRKTDQVNRLVTLLDFNLAQ